MPLADVRIYRDRNARHKIKRVTVDGAEIPALTTVEAIETVNGAPTVRLTIIGIVEYEDAGDHEGWCALDLDHEGRCRSA